MRTFVLTKAPLRVSFFGGGSDLDAFVNQSDLPGHVWSTSIDQYLYVAINRTNNPDIRVSYSRGMEIVQNVEDLKHDIVRETLKLFGITQGIEISSFSHIKTAGTGLGSSSAFCCALLKGLYHLENKEISNDEIARLACHIEIDLCKQPIGRQDQFACALGGMHRYYFYPAQTVVVLDEPPSWDESTKERFEDSLMLVDIGSSQRSASELLAAQSASMTNAEKLKNVEQIAALTQDALDIYFDGKVDKIGQMLRLSWEQKKLISPNISNEKIDVVIDIALREGASGCKLLGAGAGGYVLVCAPPEYHQRIFGKLNRRYPEVRWQKFAFENKGVHVVYSDE